MHDTLRYFRTDPLFRKHEHDQLLVGLRDAYREKFVLAISHDEVVHLKGSMAAKMPGDRWAQLAGLRLFYGFMWTHPGKKLLFMGQEFGQWREWSEAASLDWHLLAEAPHRQLQEFVAALNALYRAEPALSEGDHDPAGFRWLDADDRERSILAYLRLSPSPRPPVPPSFVVVICNFTPVPRPGYRVGVPEPGDYAELLNSDRRDYGGSGVENPAPLPAEAVPWHGLRWSVCVTLPPLSVLILKPPATAVDVAREGGPCTQGDAPAGRQAEAGQEVASGSRLLPL